MRGGKQLPRARVDGEARSSDDGQTRRRHRPRVGSAGTCKPKYTKVRRGEQVTADVVESDTVDRLIADWRPGAFEVHPCRGATNWIVGHRKDMARFCCLPRVNNEFVIAQVRHVCMI